MRLGKPSSTQLRELFLGELNARRRRGRPPWPRGDAPQDLLREWAEKGAPPAELGHYPLRTWGPAATGYLPGTSSLYERDGRLCWDAPLNTYATGPDRRGLFVWDEEAPGKWRELVAPADFHAPDLDALREALQVLLNTRCLV